MFSTTDTITAIATPAGRGGIGVVRLSGPDAHAVARRLTGRIKDFRARHATLVDIVEPGEDRGERHYVVDVQGFRKAQDEELRTEARELAVKVQTSGEDEEMGPLNPYARRIVHLAVAENPAVTTESIGEDLLKTVIISLKRA